MGLLVDFYEKARDAAQTSDDADTTSAGYHRRIVGVALVFAVLGAILGLAIAVLVAGDAKSAKDIKGVLLSPLLFAGGGFLFGTSVMCLFAPRSFLTGPVGQGWMKLIGTKSVAVARITCLLFGLMVTVPFAAIGLLIAFAK